MSDEIAKRAITCKHWRWMPGMLTLEEIVPPAVTLGWDAARVLHTDEGEVVRVCTVLGKVRDIHDTALPDLTDPATLGGLLALVREAWGDPYVYVLSCANDWFTVCSPAAEGGKWLRHPPIDGSTEAEALVAALEAAEGREVKDE